MMDAAIPASAARTFRPAINWTAEQLQSIIGLHHDGLSCREIGLKHGCSRSAIGGVIFRLREGGQLQRLKPKAIRPTTQPLHKPGVAPITRASAPYSRTFDLKAVTAPLNPLGPSRPVSGAGKLITDLADKQCKFATGYDAKGQHLFCGTETNGGPWCPEHHARVYNLKGDLKP